MKPAIKAKEGEKKKESPFSQFPPQLSQVSRSCLPRPFPTEIPTAPTEHTYQATKHSTTLTRAFRGTFASWSIVYCLSCRQFPVLLFPHPGICPVLASSDTQPAVAVSGLALAHFVSFHLCASHLPLPSRFGLLPEWERTRRCGDSATESPFRSLFPFFPFSSLFPFPCSPSHRLPSHLLSPIIRISPCPARSRLPFRPRWPGLGRSLPLENSLQQGRSAPDSVPAP